MWRVLALLVYTVMCSGIGLRKGAYCWTRPSGGGWWEHYLRGLLRVLWFAQKKPLSIFGTLSHANGMMPHMLALVERPSLRGWCIGLVGHSGVKLHANVMKTFSHQFQFLCLVGIVVCGLGVWCFGIYGLVGQGILDLHPNDWLLRYSMLGDGLSMGIWPLMLRLIFMLLSIVLFLLGS